MKVPEFALSAAHLRTRPELIARYLIKFIFPEDVLVRSNVYGGMRRGIQALDHNKISALRGEISDQRHCRFSTVDGGKEVILNKDLFSVTALLQSTCWSVFPG